MILTVTVNPALDKNYIIPGFALTGIHHVQNMSTIPAGKGLNVSRVLKTLEVPTIATGILGGHTGKQIEAGLNGAGVDHDFVWIRAESRSNILIVDEDQAIHTEIKEPGPSIPPGAWGRLKKKICQLVPRCSWVVFAGSPPPDTSPTIYFRLIQEVKALGVQVALDTRGPWLREGIKAGPDLIKPNWNEFQELVGPCYSTVQALKKARELVDQGVGTVVVSMGAKGALAVHGTEMYSAQRLPPISVVSTVGSGDALVAGLLSRLWAGREFAQALPFGLAVAGSSCAQLGAGVFDREHALALENQIRLEKIPI